MDFKFILQLLGLETRSADDIFEAKLIEGESRLKIFHPSAKIDSTKTKPSVTNFESHCKNKISHIFYGFLVLATTPLFICIVFFIWRYIWKSSTPSYDFREKVKRYYVTYNWEGRGKEKRRKDFQIIHGNLDTATISSNSVVLEQLRFSKDLPRNPSRKNPSDVDGPRRFWNRINRRF